MPTYLIIGGSAAGIGAVEAIRELDSVGSITVVSEESCSTYSRPMISDFVAGKANHQSMLCRDEDFWQSKNVQVLAERRAIGLNSEERKVRLDDGQLVEYEKLLIATGGAPFVPNIAGIDKEGVFTFTKISDAERLVERIEKKPSQKVVVVGAGLIGISVTEALVKRGLEVTVVELQRNVLSLLLDAKASGIFEEEMRKTGIAIVTGQSVQRIVGNHENDDVVGGVILTGGERVTCDLVIIAIGVVPRTDFISGTSVKTNRGILVDSLMRTNVPNVYASGDVVETFDFLTNQNRVLPLWPLAVQEGRVAGYNMAGKKTSYLGGTNMSSLKYFGLPIVSIGVANPKDETQYEILTSSDPAKKTYRKIVLEDNRIVGTTLVGDIERAGILHYMMKNRINVKIFKHELVSDSFGLSKLPPSLRKKVCLGSL
jgi:NAD(P)H-nitrite reductase large subunit